MKVGILANNRFCTTEKGREIMAHRMESILKDADSVYLPDTQAFIDFMKWSKDHYSSVYNTMRQKGIVVFKGRTNRLNHEVTDGNRVFNVGDHATWSVRDNAVCEKADKIVFFRDGEVDGLAPALWTVSHGHNQKPYEVVKSDEWEGEGLA